MIEKVADNYHAIVCPINWTTKRNGSLVMGKGTAEGFRDRFPHLDEIWGKRVAEIGDTCVLVAAIRSTLLIGLPTKRNWRYQSSIHLVQLSVSQMVIVIDSLCGVNSVLMPRPGCGFGGLDWIKVKALIEPKLDDRFTVINNEL